MWQPSMVKSGTDLGLYVRIGSERPDKPTVRLSEKACMGILGNQ